MCARESRALMAMMLMLLLLLPLAAKAENDSKLADQQFRKILNITGNISQPEPRDEEMAAR